MKFFKELPYSIYNSLRLLLKNIDDFVSNKETIPVVVSLTTMPSRISKVHLTIRSILDQGVLPFKLILWVKSSLKGNLPKSLTKLVGDVFEVRYFEYCCSHKKLIHSLQDFPNYPIITIDDDYLYPSDFINNLYEEHLNMPKAIISNRLRHIKRDNKNKVLPYSKWNNISEVTDANRYSLLIIGSSGVLYPPKALHEMVFDEVLIKKLTPKADDIWFTFMANLQKTPIILSTKSKKRLIPIIGSQKVALNKVNVHEGKNIEQWNATEHYFRKYLDIF